MAVMDASLPRVSSVPLLSLGIMMASLLPVSIAQGNASQASGTPPQGCGPQVGSLYYNLCDLSAVWGIVLEAFAAAGGVGSLVLLIVLLASLPFATDPRRRSSVGLQAGFLICTLGLFCLTFAFIVGRDFSTCASRRFLFGVLFAGCFACLVAQDVRLALLGRRDVAPRGWALCLGALGLWLVEVIINTEWLILTVVRYPTNTTGRSEDIPCNIANEDFAMALIYVMVLLLTVVVGAVPGMAAGRHKQWRRDAAFLFCTGVLSVGIWVAWITMYVYGNGVHGGAPRWDDPTLAIALVANAWVFLLLHTVPEVCSISTDEDEDQPGFHEEMYPSRGVGYENILKEQSGAQNIFMENKAFSMDEPNAGQKHVSPYSGYNGQMRGAVYQPTELALISKGVSTPEIQSYDIPRATATPPSQNGGSNPSLHTQDASNHPPTSSGNGVHKKTQW
ncbi:G-protein coupled receptor family C group 5 member C isoform X2 [Engraulis encrasicolus]|uniref:G-protein coupled receptor family C group 5 member C isoform X2 n=1 Tax=Engraulis encrasicolus TaxID=184585 RepID=UPI002FD2A2C4